MRDFARQVVARGWELFAPSGRSVQAYFKKPGYVCARADFDDFLFQEVRNKGKVAVLEGFDVKQISTGHQGVELSSPQMTLQAALLIACDGANSRAARTILSRKVEQEHHSGAVRAYYRGITPLSESGLLEIHLIKGRLPGYFWIFPLPDNRFNVGFGMLTRDLSRRKIDLKQSFLDIIATTPHLKCRFGSAVLEGEVRGFGLPLGGRKLPISGNRVLFCGDAASLIDPLNGEGIGNAMLSGKIAAAWAVKSLNLNDFSADLLKGYDAEVYRSLFRELRMKRRMQRAFNRIWLIEALVRLGMHSPRLRNWIASHL